MRTLSMVVLILFAAALALFCVQNMEWVKVTYLKWQLTAPLPMLALLIYLLGMLSGWAVVGFLRKTIRGATTHVHTAPSA